MPDTLSKSINIKVTAKERKELGAMADKDDLTLKDMVLNNTIYSTKDDELAKLSKEVEQLKEELNALDKVADHLKQANSRIKQLEAVITTKDRHLESLNHHLEQANIRLDDLTRLLDQQQALSLSAQHKIEQLENETNQSKGWFSRLFS